eukprot:IDg8020t1
MVLISLPVLQLPRKNLDYLEVGYLLIQTHHDKNATQLDCGAGLSTTLKEATTLLSAIALLSYGPLDSSGRT